MDRHVRWWVPALAACALALVLAACSSTGGGGSDSMLGSQPERAQRLYATLQREYSLQQHRQALDLAHNLLDYYPNFSRSDEVRVMGIDCAKHLGRTQTALDHRRTPGPQRVQPPRRPGPAAGRRAGGRSGH